MLSDLAPSVVGVKVTVTLQVAPTAKVPPHVFAEMEKCVPVWSAILEIVIVAPPTFFN
jgi:hypothetical protein